MIFHHKNKLFTSEFMPMNKEAHSFKIIIAAAEIILDILSVIK